MLSRVPSWLDTSTLSQMASVKTLLPFTAFRCRFLFAAHHPQCCSLPGVSMTIGSSFTFKKAFTSSVINQPLNSYVNTTVTASAIMLKYLINDLNVFAKNYHHRETRRCLSESRILASSGNSRSRQLLQHIYKVKERRLSHFKEEWTRILTEQKVVEPFWSVKWIVQHVLSKYPNSEQKVEGGYDLHLSVSQLKVANEMLNRRIQRVPVQYIIGEWDFRNTTLTMRPPVFIPEPETEVLVELVLEHCCSHLGSKEKDMPTFLDLCCGSGAIAVSLLHDNGNLRGYAVDQSEEAVALTKENAQRNRVSDRLHVHQCSINECIELFHEQLAMKFDFIVSNPPYIPTKDIAHLQPEIKEYYDRKALDGGEEGSKFIREVLSVCRHILKSKGELWLESGPEDRDIVRHLLLGNREWEMIYKSNHSDHLGRRRFHQLMRL